MHTIKFGFLSLALLSLGCDLFPGSSSNVSNSLTPPEYQPGSSGSVVKRDGGADAAELDSGAAATGGTVALDGGAGGTGGTVDSAVPDAPADVVTHPSKAWTEFGRIFDSCEWFAASTALCTTKPTITGVSATLSFELYKTSDSGKTWSLVNTVDTGNTNPAATVAVYLPTATDLWYVTGAAGATASGTIGNSPDGGLHWYSKAANVFSVLSGVSAAPVPLRQALSASSALWLLPDGNSLLRSKDGGDKWTLVTPPTDFGAATKRSLLSAGGRLYLSYLKADMTMGLYVADDFGQFSAVKDAIPVGSAGNNLSTWLHGSPNVAGLFMCDRTPLPNWGTPFWIYALVAGTTPTKIMSVAGTQTDVVGLRDGLVVERAGAVTTYLSGVFSEAGGRFLQLRRSNDGGASWSVLHSEPAATLVYASLMVDPLGTVHAMRHTSNVTGEQFAYDAHFILE